MPTTGVWASLEGPDAGSERGHYSCDTATESVQHANATETPRYEYRPYTRPGVPCLGRESRQWPLVIIDHHRPEKGWGKVQEAMPERWKRRTYSNLKVGR